MTHRMKQKPIKEGYKFFALCDAKTGFCYVTFPDGLKDKSGATWEQVVNLVRFLPDHKNKKYVAVMDNYFTQARTVKEVAKRGVATVGTTRTNVLPKEIRPGYKGREKEAQLQDKRFNTLYVQDHPDGFRCFRWLDNNIVKMVSNIHYGHKNENVMKSRKRPRANQFNRKTRKAIWKDDKAIADVEIPGIFNDYN